MRHPSPTVLVAVALAAVGCGNKTDKPGGAAAKATVETPAPTGSAVVRGVIKFEGADVIRVMSVPNSRSLTGSPQ